MERLAVDVKKAAEMTSLSPHTIRLYIRKGILPVSRVGRRVIISVDALRKLVREGCNSPRRYDNKPRECA